MKILLCILIFLPSLSFGSETLDSIPNMLFYTQRSLNKNVVIYEANFDSEGYLIPEQPIKYYWILIEEDGQVEELSYTENKLAYGLEFELMDDQCYHVILKADETIDFTLSQMAPFQAELSAQINKSQMKITNVYVQSKKTMVLPLVHFVLFEGLDINTKDFISEKVFY